MMTLLLIFVSVMWKVHGQLVPLIYAAPSAVSHQSRIDIAHSPGFITGPLIYSPAATLYATHQSENNDKSREAVITPVFTADTIFTPVALSFYHNIPLARALEHPISIDKVQEETAQNDELAKQNVESSNDEEVYNMVVTEAPEQEIQKKEEIPENPSNNYIVIAYDDNNQVISTTDEPKIDV